MSEGPQFYRLSWNWHNLIFLYDCKIPLCTNTELSLSICWWHLGWSWKSAIESSATINTVCRSLSLSLLMLASVPLVTYPAALELNHIIILFLFWEESVHLFPWWLQSFAFRRSMHCFLSSASSPTFIVCFLDDSPSDGRHGVSIEFGSNPEPSDSEPRFFSTCWPWTTLPPHTKGTPNRQEHPLRITFLPEAIGCQIKCLVPGVGCFPSSCWSEVPWEPPPQTTHAPATVRGCPQTSIVRHHFWKQHTSWSRDVEKLSWCQLERDKLPPSDYFKTWSTETHTW